MKEVNETASDVRRKRFYVQEKTNNTNNNYSYQYGNLAFGRMMKHLITLFGHKEASNIVAMLIRKVTLIWACAFSN